MNHVHHGPRGIKFMQPQFRPLRRASLPSLQHHWARLTFIHEHYLCQVVFGLFSAQAAPRVKMTPAVGLGAGLYLFLECELWQVLNEALN